jgi:hypothetical protein
MILRRLVPVLALAGAALAAAPPAGATDECRGLNPCVAVAGPWVVVPAARATPRAAAQYQLACPRGWVVGGTDAELTDGAIDVAYLGASGSPVSPGITTSRTLVFVARYAGTATRAPTFRPHIGCVPTVGGGRRTPTAVSPVVPPGRPTVRRVVTTRVVGTKRVVATCRSGERLVDWYATGAFATTFPPAPALVAGLSVSAHATDGSAVAVARARRGPGVVQVAAVCAGGR